MKRGDAMMKNPCCLTECPVIMNGLGVSAWYSIIVINRGY